MPARSQYEPPSPSRHRVLYVEDNDVNALLMQALFQRRPELDLVVAVTGGQALRMIHDIRPALLLLDLRLPDCHGSELLPRLRRICGNVPAIAVTADGVFDIAGTGFDEVWVKPLDLTHVLRRLDELLGPAYEPTDAALLI